MKKVIAIIVILAGVVYLGFYLSGQDAKPVVTNDFAAVPGQSQLLANMQKAGLDALGAEGEALHIHQHLDLNINGRPVNVPAEIGIGLTFISPVHTHDTTGVIHVESPVVKDFKLAQFFDEWGIDFNDNCIGSNCTDQKNKLIVAVNGAPIADVRNHVLKAHDEIEVWFGPKTENPQLIKSYNFPQGL